MPSDWNSLSWPKRVDQLRRHYARLERRLDKVAANGRAARSRLQWANKRIKELSHEIQLLGSARWQTKPVLKSRGDVRADSTRYTAVRRAGDSQGLSLALGKRKSQAVYLADNPDMVA